MAVIDKRSPWFARFTRLIEKCWAHHGPCVNLHVASAFDTDRREWLIVVAPVFQEVLGGEDDGKTVWTGFVFHADDRGSPLRRKLLQRVQPDAHRDVQG